MPKDLLFDMYGNDLGRPEFITSYFIDKTIMLTNGFFNSIHECACAMHRLLLMMTMRRCKQAWIGAQILILLFCISADRNQ